MTPTASLPCPGCGRPYDADRLTDGRTLRCTCGHRVAFPERVGGPPPGAPLRLAADAMLGRLARWLRTLGIDTCFDPESDDAALARRAVAEGRILLTRDRRLLEDWRVRGHRVHSEEPLEQLVEVLSAVGVPPPGGLFTRCRMCNTELEGVPAGEVQGLLPPAVRKNPGPLRRCPGCGRLYWEGSHTARMRETLARVLDRVAAGDTGAEGAETGSRREPGREAGAADGTRTRNFRRDRPVL